MKLEGWTEAQPPPDLPALINEALQTWSWEAEYITAQATFPTVASQAEYDLDALSPGGPIWKFVTDCYYGSKELTRKSTDFIRTIDPRWLLATAAEPTMHFMVRPNVLRFYPPPSTVQTVTIFGVQEDTPLVADDDTPKCPTSYHRNIPRLAAWCYGEAFAQGEAAQRLDGYYEKAMAAAGDFRAWLAAQNQRGLQRTVKRRGVSRVFLTGEDTSVISM